MKQEFNFKKAKKVGSKFKNKDVKVSVTARLDPDIVSWLRTKSEELAIPYQTFMNSLLKQAMVGSSLTEERVRYIVKEELLKKVI